MLYNEAYQNLNKSLHQVPSKFRINDAATTVCWDYACHTRRNTDGPIPPDGVPPIPPGDTHCPGWSVVQVES